MIDIVASGTRKEELLLSERALAAANAVRRRIDRKAPITAMTDLLVDFKRYPTNEALIGALTGG